MITRQDIEQEVEDLVTCGIIEGRPQATSWIVNAILKRHPDHEGEDADFYAVLARGGAADHRPPSLALAAADGGGIALEGAGLRLKPVVTHEDGFRKNERGDHMDLPPRPRDAFAMHAEHALLRPP